jgi:hypothetical protein
LEPKLSLCVPEQDTVLLKLNNFSTVKIVSQRIPEKTQKSAKICNEMLQTTAMRVISQRTLHTTIASEIKEQKRAQVQ